MYNSTSDCIYSLESEATINIKAESEVQILYCYITIYLLTGIPTGNSNEGNKFCFTFLHNKPHSDRIVKYLEILIGTKENEIVQYRIRSGVTVVNRNGTVNPGQITVEQYTIYEADAQNIESIPGNDTNNKFTGIIVETVNSTQKIVVTAFSSNAVGFSDGFCAVPIIDYPFNINGDHPYTYTAFSTKGIGSAMLAMVACNNLEANDVIITHVSLDNISDVYFLETGQSKAWDTYTTAMVASTSDITGVYVLSNQPIGVMVGHECGGVSDLVCGYITEQIPPSYTWGYNFFITPFIGHKETGYVLKVLPRYNNTNYTLYCMDSNGVTYDIIVHNLMKSEAMITDRTYFNTINSQSHCCIKSDRPLAVMQYSKSSYEEKSNGGPSMVWIAPVSQYLNYHLFSNEIPIQTTFNVISVTVLSQCFDTSYITINGTHLELDVTKWTPIYCTNTSTSACGYGINKAIDKGTYIVRHSIATCHINVIVYGWGIRRGCAYPAGYGMNPVGGKYIQLYI